MNSTHDDFRAMVKYDVLRGLSKQECISQLVKTFGDEAPSSETLKTWYAEFTRSKRAESKSRLNSEEAGEMVSRTLKRSAKNAQPVVASIEEDEDAEPPVKKGRAKKTTTATADKAKNHSAKEEPKLVVAKKENSLEIPKSRGKRARTTPSVPDKEPNVPATDLPNESEVLVNAISKVRRGGRKIINEQPAVEDVPEAQKEAKSTKPAIEVKKKRGATKEAPIEKEVKPAAKARGRKRATAEPNDSEADVDGGKLASTNTTESEYNKADFELPPSAVNGGESGPEKRFNLKVSSWNVAGLRAWLKKDGLKFLDYEEPDIFCMQETKCANDQLPDEVVRISGYHPYWLCMPGGYAGVAIYSKIMPINVTYGIGHKEFDDVGRMITAEYEKFYLINVYVPNSGRKLVNLDMRMRWEDTFQAYCKKLDALKPLVICGDMNVSHLEIDLANPKSNTRNAGFTKEERDKMTELLALGFVDTFRNLYPKRTGAYTFWTYMSNARARNVGWRLDYFIVSERFASRVVDNCIRSQCKGSDHCPITLFMKM